MYEQVTSYVREEMNRADRLTAEGEGRRGNTVGFALTVLQRRLASSPEAIYQSLRRRRERLERRLAEERLLKRGAEVWVDTERHVIRPGTSVFVRAGAVHGFVNVGDGPLILEGVIAARELRATFLPA